MSDTTFIIVFMVEMGALLVYTICTILHWDYTDAKEQKAIRNAIIFNLCKGKQKYTWYNR